MNIEKNSERLDLQSITVKNSAIITCIMKVLFINPHSLRNWGGNEIWVSRMGELLQEKGIKVELMSLDHTPGEINRVNQEFIKSKINFDYTELKTRGGKYTPLRASKIPELDADVIYTTVPYYGFLKQISKISIPKIWGFHDPSLQTPSNFLQRKLLNELLPKFDLVHLLSSTQIEKAAKSKKIKVLETTWMYELPECKAKYDQFTLMFYGRHETDKGIDTLIKMKSELGSTVRFIVAGFGPRTRDLEGKFSKEELVGFLNREELLNYVQRSHVTLFPSYSESTTSLVAMESLANCTPLLFRDIPVNENLKQYSLNIMCKDDMDFLKGAGKLKDLFEADEVKYLEECRKLQSKIVTYKEYIDIFVNEILLPAMER